MTGQRIDSIDIEGYLSIRSAHVELRDLNVLVGANGSGKSNFISALEILGRIADGDLRWYVGHDRGGAGQLMYRWASDGEIRLHVELGNDAYEAGLVRSADDELVFASERLWYEVPGSGRYEASLGRGHQETRLRKAGDVRDFVSAADRALDLLGGCRAYHFHDTSHDAPMKRFADEGDNIVLASDAANLAPFLARLRAAEPNAYRRIVSTIQVVAPFFGDFVLEAESPDHMRLRWRQGSRPDAIKSSSLSDGTLRFICLATLLLQPDPPQLVVLDEPELGLHPFAIVMLAEMLRTAAQRCQVAVATQSVTLMNQFGVGDLLVVDRVEGGSTFTRHDPGRFAGWLADYSLGELWEKNLLGGRPARETA